MLPGATPGAIEAAALALVDAQPSMASIFNLADQVLWRSGDPPGAAAVCQEFARGLKENVAYVAQEAGKLIPAEGTVLTHSSSGTVREALLQAGAGGKRIRVIATESRPTCEGRSLAGLLAEAGMAVTLIVDAATSLFVPRADLVLVGADAVSPAGLLNKIGTRSVALAAQAAAKPIYSLCDSSKILRGDVPLPEEAPRDPAELLAGFVLPGVEAANYYFEWTPLRLITGIVIEAGIYTADELRESTREVVLHPALARRRENR